jgi:DNA replication factor GINS
MPNMSLEELNTLLTKERELDNKLQEIGDSFYEDAAAYIQKLEDERKAALKYQEMDMLTDELKNARIVIEGIFDIRRRKIIEFASVSVSGTKMDIQGLTTKEKVMHEIIVSALERGRKEILIPILEPLSGQNPAKNILGETTTKEKPIENTIDQNEAEDLMMVKVLKDIPRFVGVDGRQYQLSSEDVVVLPKANALVLCNKNVAIPLENFEAAQNQ